MVNISTGDVDLDSEDLKSRLANAEQELKMEKLKNAALEDALRVKEVESQALKKKARNLESEMETYTKLTTRRVSSLEYELDEKAKTIAGLMAEQHAAKRREVETKWQPVSGGGTEVYVSGQKFLTGKSPTTTREENGSTAAQKRSKKTISADESVQNVVVAAAASTNRQTGSASSNQRKTSLHSPTPSSHIYNKERSSLSNGSGNSTTSLQSGREKTTTVTAPSLSASNSSGGSSFSVRGGSREKSFLNGSNGADSTEASSSLDGSSGCGSSVSVRPSPAPPRDAAPKHRRRVSVRSPSVPSDGNTNPPVLPRSSAGRPRRYPAAPLPRASSLADEVVPDPTPFLTPSLIASSESQPKFSTKPSLLPPIQSNAAGTTSVPPKSSKDPTSRQGPSRAAAAAEPPSRGTTPLLQPGDLVPPTPPRPANSRLDKLSAEVEVMALDKADIEVKRPSNGTANCN